MTEESPRKRARLCEDEVDNLCKPEIQEHIKKQEEYISELEARLELSAPSSSNNGDGEDKLRHLKAARREQLLVMRLTTKEQELHELANQLADKTQNASTAQLRSATVDPALNLLVQRLKKELEDKSTNLKQAHEDMAAWKFTPDSQTGKRLMARCRTLIQENQELGKQVSQGKVAQVEAELALQKEINEELKSSQDEMYEMVIQLNDEGEGMQSTILALQQELKEKQLENARLTYAAESAGVLLTPDSTPADMKHEPQIEDNGGQNMQTDNPQNMQEDTYGKHVEPSKEIVEPKEESMGNQIPDVRTTEYTDNETPMDDVVSQQEPGLNKSLSVEPWCNPSHFVESPASPVDDVAEQPTPSLDATTSKFEEREIPEYERRNSPTDSDGQLVMEEQPSEQHTEFTEIQKEVREEEEEFQVRTPLDESSQGSFQSHDDRDDDNIGTRTRQRSDQDDGDNDVIGTRTSERSSHDDRDNDVIGTRTRQRSSHDDRDNDVIGTRTRQRSSHDDRDNDVIGTRTRLRSSHDDQDVNVVGTKSGERSNQEDHYIEAVNNRTIERSIENDRDIDAVSTRTNERSSEDDRDVDAVSERSGTITPDFSTNGDESHPEPFLDTVQNNGKGFNPGRLGEDDLSTLVKDPSTCNIERDVINNLDNQSDITDKQSDVTDAQSDVTTTDNNNGLSNSPGDEVSSPQENCAPDEARTENVIKSLNSNSYSPNERIQSEQCDEATPSNTNSNPEELSV